MEPFSHHTRLHSAGDDAATAAWVLALMSGEAITWGQTVQALGMCAGVAVFSLADQAASPNFSTLVGCCRLKPVLKANGAVWLLNETKLR